MIGVVKFRSMQPNEENCSDCSCKVQFSVLYSSVREVVQEVVKFSTVRCKVEYSQV